MMQCCTCSGYGCDGIIVLLFNEAGLSTVNCIDLSSKAGLASQLLSRTPRSAMTSLIAQGVCDSRMDLMVMVREKFDPEG